MFACNDSLSESITGQSGSLGVKAHGAWSQLGVYGVILYKYVGLWTIFCSTAKQEVMMIVTAHIMKSKCKNILKASRLA